RTLATFKDVKTNGSAVGTRTWRQIAKPEAAYDRISSIWRGLALCNPRSVFTITGRKHRTAAMAIFELGDSGLNQLFRIGANAMIGMAFAATASGISAEPSVRKREMTVAAAMPAIEPIANPPSASLNVYQP